MSQEPINDLSMGDDVRLGYSTALVWDESWPEPHPSEGPDPVFDNVKIDVVVIAGRDPRTVELCFDWHNQKFPPPREIYDHEGVAYESPAIPLQLTPEAAIELGRLLIEAGERSKK